MFRASSGFLFLIVLTVQYFSDPQILFPMHKDLPIFTICCDKVISSAGFSAKELYCSEEVNANSYISSCTIKINTFINAMIKKMRVL